jgi:uncharacterized membrane protein
MKIIRNLLTTFLVLLSITVAFASIASDISVTSTNNNGAIAHGQTDSRTLTFTNSNSTDSFNVAATSPNSTIQIPISNQILVSNLSSNTLSYNVSVPEHTSPGNYSYDIEYNGSTETFYYTVPSADTKTIQFADSTITVENGTNAQFTLNLNNTGNLDYIFGNELLEVLKLNKNNQVNLTGSDQFSFTTFNAGEEQNGSITFTTNSSSEFGIYTGNYVYSLGGVNTSLAMTVSVLPESHDTRLELEFDLDDITNDDSDTYPGDYMRISDISITNEYTNNDEDSIEDIELEYNVYLVSDGDDIIEEEYSQSFDLEEDQDVDEFDIQFQVPYDAVAGKYIVEVIITGEISSDGSDDGNEISNRVYETFSVDRDSRHIIPTAFELSNSCSLNPTLNVDLTNIGTSDLDEDDDIYVEVRIPDLGHSKWYFFNDSIDSDDTEQFEIELELPENTEDGNYVIELTSKHDGNSNSNKDGSKLSSTFDLDCGNVLSDNSDIMITGKTSEEGKSGSQTKYTLSLTNRKDIAVKYDLAVDEFNWGTAIVNPNSVTLQPGATTSFDVFVMPGENAQESNSLTLDINQNGKTVLSKNLEMNLPQTGIRSLFGGSSNRQSESNPVLALLIIAMAYIGIREYKMVQKSNKKASKKRK